MARAKNHNRDPDKEIRNGRLEEAMATLLQNQAALVQSQIALASQKAAGDHRMAETDRQMAETNRLNAERFARIEAILGKLVGMLHALPDAIRDKIGFKVPEQTRPSP